MKFDLIRNKSFLWAFAYTLIYICAIFDGSNAWNYFIPSAGDMYSEQILKKFINW